jgi:hypothetical protein
MNFLVKPAVQAASRQLSYKRPASKHLEQFVVAVSVDLRLNQYCWHI